MKIDNYRLSFSIREDSFYITDSISGNTLVYSKGSWMSDNLDKEVVIDHIKTLQEAMLTFKPQKASLFEDKSNMITSSKGVIIRENGKFDWSVCHEDCSAVIQNNRITYLRGFDYKIIVNRLNYMFTLLLNKGATLNPKRDIVRRIADVGVLVWVYGKHSLVVYESCIKGCTMYNCLINGVYYDTVLVSSSRESGTTTLFKVTEGEDDMKEIISFPLDTSILEYYPPDEDAFND